MPKENFVITIGDFGSLIMLHSGNKITKSLYVKDLQEDEEIIKLNALLHQNHSAPITILLDNLDQTYKKKTYPLVGLNSLKNIAKREMASDGDKTSFKNFIPYIPKKSSGEKKSECLYISASKSELIDKWVDIIMQLPNRITGIHVLPVEGFQLLKMLTQKTAKTQIKTTSQKQILSCLILRTKVGGIRQLVFCDRGIIFTRIVNYDFNDISWLERYEQDLYSTFEYLKRSFPNIKIRDLNFYNIFNQEILDKINSIGNKDLKFTNYTPRQASRKCGLGNMISEKEDYSDILISKIFFIKKKILRFTTKQIQKFEYFFLLLQGSYILNAIAVVSLVVTLISIAMYSSQTTYLIERSKKLREIANNELKNTQVFEEQEDLSAKNFGANNVERIIDFGQIDEKLNQDNEQDFLEFYAQLAYIKKYDSQLASYRYFLEKFNYKRPNNTLKHTVKIEGKMNNKTGDIDDLFKNFDNVSNATLSAFKNYKVDYKEIPRTINFTKKYYDYPINFTISNRREGT